MADVDAILAGGRYTDRRGRLYYRESAARYWWTWKQDDPLLSPDQMRLKINRDLHRDECPGLRECFTHPVPQVFTDEDGDFCAYPALGGPDLGTWYDTLGVALDAARHMTGETP